MSIIKPFVRSPYNYDVDKASIDEGLECKDKSYTIQSQADEADINTIVRRFGLTGQMPVAVRPPEFGDFTEIGDFTDAMNAIKTAQDSFMKMPAEFRFKLNNDPQLFVEFCSDPRNLEEMRKYGLAPAVPPPPFVAPTPPTP